jgi:uncharacterized protein (TIGR02118 family)
MVKVSVFYPNRKGARFDIEYYCNRHMPLVKRLVGAALKGVSVEHGICGEHRARRPLMQRWDICCLIQWKHSRPALVRTCRKSWRTFRSTPT